MIISQTPFRISICGGGTDFEDFYKQNGGAVISTTINKYVYIVVKERFDNKISASYFNSEVVDDICELRHDLIRESALLTGMKTGFEVYIMSDIPSSGSGLGSSSSVTVGLLNAFYAYQGKFVDAKTLAEQACIIEIDVLKNPIGKQDQYAAAFGGLNYINFNSNDIVVNKIELENGMKRRIESNLMLFFTNITRKSSAILTEQKENISKTGLQLLDIKHLTQELNINLIENNVDEIGTILHKNWLLKKQLSSNISNNTIDMMYNLAIGAGAIGGKIAGAGGGGFLMVYSKPDKHDSVRNALKNHKQFPFLLEPHGSKIIFNYNIQELK